MVSSHVVTGLYRRHPWSGFLRITWPGLSSLHPCLLPFLLSGMLAILQGPLENTSLDPSNWCDLSPPLKFNSTVIKCAASFTGLWTLSLTTTAFIYPQGLPDASHRVNASDTALEMRWTIRFLVIKARFLWSPLSLTSKSRSTAHGPSHCLHTYLTRVHWFSLYGSFGLFLRFMRSLSYNITPIWDSGERNWYTAPWNLVPVKCKWN